MAEAGKDTLKKAAGTEKLDIQQKIQQNQATYGHFVVPDFAPPTPPEGAVKYVTPPASPRPDKDKSKKDKDKTDKDKDKSKKDKPPKPEKDKTEKDKDKANKPEKDKDKDKAAKPEKDKTENKAAKDKPEKDKPVEKEKSEKWSLMRKATMAKVSTPAQEEPPIFVPVNIVEAKPPPRPTRPPTAPPIATLTRQATNADETQPDFKDGDALPTLPGLPPGDPLLPDETPPTPKDDEALPILPALPPGQPVIPGEFNETMYAHLTVYSRQRHGSTRNLGGDAPLSPRSPRSEKPLPQPIQEQLSDSTTESHSESTSESKPVDPSLALGEALAWIDSYGEPQPEIIPSGNSTLPYLDRIERDSTTPSPGGLGDSAKGLNPHKKAESRKSGKRGDHDKKTKNRSKEEDKKEKDCPTDKKPKKKNNSEIATTTTEADQQQTGVEEGGGSGGTGTKRSRKEKSRAVVLDKTVLEEAILPGDSK